MQPSAKVLDYVYALYVEVGKLSITHLQYAGREAWNETRTSVSVGLAVGHADIIDLK